MGTKISKNVNGLLVLKLFQLLNGDFFLVACLNSRYKLCVMCVIFLIFNLGQGVRTWDTLCTIMKTQENRKTSYLRDRVKKSVIICNT